MNKVESTLLRTTQAKDSFPKVARDFPNRVSNGKQEERKMRGTAEPD